MNDSSKLAHYEFQDLAAAGVSLNQTTDRLSKSVAEIDFALKRLNLGIQCWVDVASGASPDGCRIWNDQIGYSKISGKWGIALRRIDAADGDVDEWLFNDAPRDLRVQAVKCIPDLFAALTGQVSAITAEIQSQLPQAEAFVSAIKGQAELADAPSEESR